MKIELNNNKVIFIVGQNQTEIHPIWLRERVRDEKFLDKNNDQRLFDPSFLENISIEESKLSSVNFAKLIERISDKTISGKIAKSVLEEIWVSGNDVDLIIQEKGLVQIQDESILEDIAKKIIEANPDQVNAYKGGKEKLFGFFVGQVMKETQGKANPQGVNEVLKKLLDT